MLLMTIMLNKIGNETRLAHSGASQGGLSSQLDAPGAAGLEGTVNVRGGIVSFLSENSKKPWAEQPGRQLCSPPEAGLPQPQAPGCRRTIHTGKGQASRSRLRADVLWDAQLWASIFGQ